MDIVLEFQKIFTKNYMNSIASVKEKKPPQLRIIK